MPTKKKTTKTKNATSAHHAVSTVNASTTKETTMPKTSHATPASHSAVTPAVPVEIAAQPATAPATPATSPPPASGASTTPGGFVPPPPAPDPSFVPPTGFVPDNTMDFRGVLPRTSELVAMPMAVADLVKFTDYLQVMGSRVPPLAQMQEAFTVTNQWSSARTAADAWDQYARAQEGVAWSRLRPLMASIAPAFAVAVSADPAFAAKYPGLTTLLCAKMIIAHKGASTKKANKQAVAEGKPPTHGKVGKKATKAAQKAALAEKQAAGNAASSATPSAPPAPVQPPPVSAVPSNGGGAPALSTPAATPANGGLNGAGSGAH
jgi:hypothetical protein